MQIEPAFEGFGAAYAAGKPQVVWTRLVADLETPVSAYLKLAAGRANTFLLESVEGGAVRGRYSMIGLDPDLIFKAEGNEAAISRAPTLDKFEPAGEPTLVAIRAMLGQSRIDMPAGLPPSAAGIFGYLGYDTVRLIEDLPDEPADILGLPDTVLVRPQIVVVFDSVSDELTIVTPARPETGVNARQVYDRATDRLTAIVEALDRPLDHTAETADVDLDAEILSNTMPADYMAMVEKAKDYIAAGDIFQVVLSQRFEAPFPLPPFALYRALRRINPSPFLYFLAFEGYAIVGSSPEILVRLRDGTVTVRPIAGTRPRGATADEDQVG